MVAPSHSSVSETLPSSASASRTWLAVTVLAIAAFTMVTTEFAPIGLLSQIATDLGRNPGEVGLTVTLYAWIGAVSGLLSALVFSRVPRKPLLLALMAVITLANVGVMFSESFATLLWVRAGGAVAHGVFWATVAATAAQIAPPGRMGLATSIVFGGISVATVLGVPLVNLIGQASGWRLAFGAIAALGLATCALMLVVIPTVKGDTCAQRFALLTVVCEPRLRGVFAITACVAAAHFWAYTFIEPFLGQIPGIAPVTVALLLFGFGLSGFAGNVLTGMLIDRLMKPVIVAGLLALCLALLGLGVFGPGLGVPTVLVLLTVWGAAIATLFGGLQTWVLRAAGPAAIPAAAIHTFVLNAAIGIGATLGAWVLGLTSVAGVMASAGLVVVLPLLLMAWPMPANSSKRAPL